MTPAAQAPTRAAAVASLRMRHDDDRWPCPGQVLQVALPGAHRHLGGAGFLGLHLARRLRADGHAVQSLDLVPLDGPCSRVKWRRSGRRPGSRGGARLGRRRRRRRSRRRSVADPGGARGDPVGQRRRHRDGARGRAGRGRAAARSSSPRLPCTASRRPSVREDDPLVGVGAYGGSKIEAEAVCRAFGCRGWRR